MKYLLAATFVFLITLGLTVQSLASSPEAGHGDHVSQMNSLFPEKQKDAELSTSPATVVLTSPKFLSRISGAAKLEWKATQGANAYHVQVATDPNFKWLVAEDHFVKTNSFDFAKTEAGQKYYWRVAAVNTENESMFTKSNFESSVFVAQ